MPDGYYLQAIRIVNSAFMLLVVCHYYCGNPVTAYVPQGLRSDLNIIAVNSLRTAYYLF